MPSSAQSKKLQKVASINQLFVSHLKVAALLNSELQPGEKMLWAGATDPYWLHIQQGARLLALLGAALALGLGFALLLKFSFFELLLLMIGLTFVILIWQPNRIGDEIKTKLRMVTDRRVLVIGFDKAIDTYEAHLRTGSEYFFPEMKEVIAIPLESVKSATICKVYQHSGQISLLLQSASLGNESRVLQLDGVSNVNDVYQLFPDRIKKSARCD